jgi:uncharacterized protein YdaU (DUF1376 family)
MSLVEEGAYRRALDKAWKEGSLPADPKACAARIGKGCSIKVAETVLTMFRPMVGNVDRVVSPKLEKVRKEQKLKNSKNIAKGKKGALKRWKNKTSADSPTIAEPMPKQWQKNRTEQIRKEEFKTSESVTPVREIFLGTVTSELAKRMDLKTLPAKLEWEQKADWAYTNGFTSDDFLECYDLLAMQHWRDGPVKPKHVVENLPNLNKLRKEIEKQKNGTSKQNGSRNSADQRAARAVQKHNIIAETRARVEERERAESLPGEDADHSS